MWLIRQHSNLFDDFCWIKVLIIREWFFSLLIFLYYLKDTMIIIKGGYEFKYRLNGSYDLM